MSEEHKWDGKVLGERKYTRKERSVSVIEYNKSTITDHTAQDNLRMWPESNAAIFNILCYTHNVYITEISIKECCFWFTVWNVLVCDMQRYKTGQLQFIQRSQAWGVCLKTVVTFTLVQKYFDIACQCVWDLNLHFLSVQYSFMWKLFDLSEFRY